MIDEQQLMKEVLRYIQMPYEKADEGLKQKIKALYRQLEACVKPRWTYQCFEIQRSEAYGVTFLGTTLTLVSKDLQALLQNSDRCYLLAATLGIEADKIIQTAQLRDMGEALILDACANVMIEAMCDTIEHELSTVLPNERYMTMRYSPGYGDVMLDVQNQVLAVLQAQKRIGLTVTTSQMMVPFKSVTAFIGISNQKEKRMKTCSTCTLKDVCNYRKRGEQCGC